MSTLQGYVDRMSLATMLIFKGLIIGSDKVLLILQDGRSIVVSLLDSWDGQLA